jgi:hypothetical protein
MDPKPSNKFLLVVVGLFAAAGIAVANIGPSAPAAPAPLPASVLEAVIPSQVAPKEAPQSAASASLSNDNYYTNSDGNTVHSPAYNEEEPDTAPAGASARCGDGTYSFSQHRSGTCSHHGGVAEWL